MNVRALSQAAATLAWLGLLIPQGAIAAAPVDKALCSDVSLHEGGLLVGQVVNAQGRPFAETTVAVRHGNREVLRTKTDEHGRFAASGLRAGVHQVVVADNQLVTYRLWSADVAPPAANESVLVVTTDAILNGQCGCGTGCGDIIGEPCGCGGAVGCGPCLLGGGLGGFIRNNPVLVAGGVAAAIAIPLAVADDDDPAS